MTHPLTRIAALILLLSPCSLPAAEPTPSSAALLDRVRAAARTGTAEEINQIIDASHRQPPGMDQAAAAALLDEFLAARDLRSFSTLYRAMRRTNLGRDWQPSDETLAALVRDDQQDIVALFIAEPTFKLDRLDPLAASAPWLAARLDHARKQRDVITALVKASGEGDLDTITRLLDAGLDVNSVDAREWTPLTRASLKGQAAAVTLLLSRGADPNLPRLPGWDYTPLCLTRSVEVADLLLAAGADIHARLFRRDVSILTYVARFGPTELVEWFIRHGVDPKKIGDNDQTLLFDSGNARTTELLLKHGLDPNRPDEFGRTPLGEARDAGTVRLLIQHGAKLDTGKYPTLLGMIQMGKAEAIDEVIRQGARADAPTLQRALLSAAHMDRDDTIRVLIKHGAKVNEPGSYGEGDDHKMLPLTMCSIHGGVKAARVLLENGADPNPAGIPFNLVENAMRNGYPQLVELLRQHGAIGPSDLTIAIFSRDTARIATLLADAPTFQQDPAFWRGVLPQAAGIGDLDTIRAALAQGVPPLGATAKENALSSAAQEGQHEALALLLDQPQSRTEAKPLRQALWDAVWNSHPYPKQRPAEHFEKTVRLLLDAGAPVKDTVEGPDLVTTAVFTRYPGGNPRVIQMLVDAGADPNPTVGKDGHLLDLMRKACESNTCSTPTITCMQLIERLTTKTASARPAP